MPNPTQSQIPAKPDPDFVLNGFQLPKDKNFRRLYDALKIVTGQVRELGSIVASIIVPEPIAPVASSNLTVEERQQITKQTNLFDIMKRVSCRL